MTETHLLDLIVAIYEAAVDPSLWPVFLERYAEAVSADIAFLQVHDFRRRRSEIQAVFGMNTPFKQSYNEHYSELNVWRNHGQRLYREGRSLLDHELCPDELLKKTEFYNDYLRPMGGVRCMASVIIRESDMAPTLTALRGERKHCFDGPELKIAQHLLPHLRRTVQVSRRVEVLQAGEAVVNRMPFGILFLGSDGRAIFANHTAEAIFRENDGLTLQAGSLCASDRITDKALKHAIRQVLTINLSCPSGVRVERKSQRRPYHVVAAPMRRRCPQFVGTPTPVAVVLIDDPERSRAATPELIASIYGLTLKEAEVVAKLVEGKGVDELAVELGMKYETARTHLRRIFFKTGTTRQTELIRVLGRIPRPPWE